MKRHKANEDEWRQTSHCTASHYNCPSDNISRSRRIQIRLLLAVVMTKTKINVGYVYCSATIRSLAGMIWPGSVTVTALDLRLKRRGFYSQPFRLSSSNPRQVVYTHCLCHPSCCAFWYRLNGTDALWLERKPQVWRIHTCTVRSIDAASYCYRWSGVVPLAVWVLATTLSPVKRLNRLSLRCHYGVRVCPKNHVLDGVHVGATWRIP